MYKKRTSIFKEFCEIYVAKILFFIIIVNFKLSNKKNIFIMLYKIIMMLSRKYKNNNYKNNNYNKQNANIFLYITK